jgi:hypothetical protein
MVAVVVGSAVVGGAASIYSSKKAAGAAEDASKRSDATQRYMYDQSRRDYAPYRDVGVSALDKLSALYGIQRTPEATPTSPQVNFQGMQGLPGGGTFFGQVGDVFRQVNNTNNASNAGAQTQSPYVPADFSDFYNSPDYQFAYDEGMRATNQSLARRGLSGSGAAMKELTRFGQGLASQNLGNYKNSLAALAGVGQSATGQLSQLGANTANNISASQLRAGDARGSAYLNTGSAISGASNQIGNLGLLSSAGVI